MTLVRPSRQLLSRVIGRLKRGAKLAAYGLPGPWRTNRCPACGFRTRGFQAGGVVRRENAQCPRCSSLERHRAMWLYLERETPFRSRELRVLVVAPDRWLERRGRKLHQDYLSIDLEPGAAMRQMDLTQLDLPDVDRDLLVAFHVLEHIPDDRGAMREIARVLRPGGLALLEVPLAGDETDERFINGTLEERRLHYGQDDHVRMYGARDFESRLRESGLDPMPVRVGEALADEVQRAALVPDEVFYAVRKQPAPGP